MHAPVTGQGPSAPSFQPELQPYINMLQSPSLGGLVCSLALSVDINQPWSICRLQTWSEGTCRLQEHIGV